MSEAFNGWRHWYETGQQLTPDEHIAEMRAYRDRLNRPIDKRAELIGEAFLDGWNARDYSDLAPSRPSAPFSAQNLSEAIYDALCAEGITTSPIWDGDGWDKVGARVMRYVGASAAAPLSAEKVREAAQRIVDAREASKRAWIDNDKDAQDKTMYAFEDALRDMKRALTAAPAKEKT